MLYNIFLTIFVIKNMFLEFILLCHFAEQQLRQYAQRCSQDLPQTVFNTKNNRYKAKGRICKRVFQENKACQIFRKNEHLLPPDTQTYVCVSGNKKCLFFEIFGVL